MNSKLYEISGRTDKKAKWVVKVDAESKQRIWNNPEAYGFRKLFSVKEVKQ